jgi:tetratricopeptide (TPR) repeat protein
MRTRPTLRRFPALLGALAFALAMPLGAQDHAALGRAALARADYPAAVEHLEAASRELEGGNRDALSQVQIDLGIAYLTGLARPADALRAFVRAADLAANPASAWLWASTAAAQLGDPGEAERYKRLALGRRLAPSTPPAPEPAAAPEPPKSAAPEAAPAAEPAVAAVKAEAPPAAAKTKDLKDSKDGKDEKKPETAPTAKPTGSAFDHFFKRKPADEPQEPAAAEPPPAGVSERS